MTMINRVRVVMPYGQGYLMERMNNPKYPDNLGKKRFPGGGVDAGETARQAAVREMKEELGQLISARSLRLIGDYSGGQHGTERYYRLDKHKLSPGNYEASIGGDKNIELIESKAEGADFWGADPASLGKKQANTVLRRLVKLVPSAAPTGPFQQGRSAWDLMLKGKRIGGMQGYVEPGGVRIRLSELDPKFHGMGLGKKMYGELAKQSPNNTLISDFMVSDKAQRVWGSMRKRPHSYSFAANDFKPVKQSLMSRLTALLRKPRPKALPEPGGEWLYTSRLNLPAATKQAASGWLDTLKHHAPRIRLDDSLVGGGIGAATGAISAALSNAGRESDDPDRASYLQRMTVGAGLGAAAGNLVADRGRRYLVNNLPAAGYGNSDHASHLKPKSLRQVFDTAILDNPTEAVVGGVRQPGRLGEFSLKSDASQARYQLFRLAAGLPLKDPENAYFISKGKTDWTPTATSGGLAGRFNTVGINPKIMEAQQADPDSTLNKMMKRLEYVKRRPDREGDYPAFGDWLSRHGYRRGSDGSMSVEDLWDFALTPDETTQLSSYAKDFLKNPKSMSETQTAYPEMTGQGWKSPWDPLWEGTDFVPNKRQHATELIKRKLINTLMLSNGGVLFQQDFSPLQLQSVRNKQANFKSNLVR